MNKPKTPAESVAIGGLLPTKHSRKDAKEPVLGREFSFPVLSLQLEKRQEPKRVVVTGASNPIGSRLLPRIASGDVFGKNTLIQLNLLDLPDACSKLEGVMMDLYDCAYPLVLGILFTTDPVEAFDSADYVICCASVDTPDAAVSRNDLLKADRQAFEDNIALYDSHATVLNEVAAPNCKVLVVASPANTLAWVLKERCDNLKQKNFTALTRHFRNRFPDVSQVLVDDDKTAGLKHPLGEYNLKEEWIWEEYLASVSSRAEEIYARKRSTDADSTVKGIVDHMKDWLQGNVKGELGSMGVVSDGDYYVDEGLIFSFPVYCLNGEWRIVEDLNLPDRAYDLIARNVKQLSMETEIAKDVLERIEIQKKEAALGARTEEDDMYDEGF